MTRKECTPLECTCAANYFEVVFDYRERPAGEPVYSFTASKPYRRQMHQCHLCGHFVSRHKYDPSNLYEQDYVSSSYRDLNGLKKNFDRVISLPPEKSDNFGRSRCVHQFAERRYQGGVAKRTILDVGSGLCVFLHEMKQFGWDGTALDPDPRSCSHARSSVGVKALCGDFMNLDGLGNYDVISFNKVLEHVEEPVEMLRKARSHLKFGGFIYLELPDGEAAQQEGFNREEFFIDHLHVFSPASTCLLVQKAGGSILSFERLREPSGKFTLRTFMN